MQLRRTPAAAPSPTRERSPHIARTSAGGGRASNRTPGPNPWHFKAMSTAYGCSIREERGNTMATAMESPTACIRTSIASVVSLPQHIGYTNTTNTQQERQKHLQPTPEQTARRVTSTTRRCPRTASSDVPCLRSTGTVRSCRGSAAAAPRPRGCASADPSREAQCGTCPATRIAHIAHKGTHHYT